jgi:hypothetical protein
MDAGLAPAHQARARHRHELRTLTYVTLDQANGGIVRNLSHDGIAVQAVAAVRPRQQLRVRFELRYPRLRVETRGEVVWSTFSGQCGIRFLDLSPRQVRQIDEWIFGDLLEGYSIPSDRTGLERAESVLTGLGMATFAPGPAPAASNGSSASVASLPAGVTARILSESKRDEFKEAEPDPESLDEDGLMVSPAPLRIIELPSPGVQPVTAFAQVGVPTFPVSAPAPVRASMAATVPMPTTMPARVNLEWLSQPLSSRSLAWTVDTLILIAALLLFVFVFLSVTREPPKWPVTLTSGAAIVIGGLYWGFFKMFGGASFGTRLARLTGMGSSSGEDADERFR